MRDLNCEYCRRNFRNKRHRRFCSRTCYLKHKAVPRYRKQCIYCKTLFITVKPKQCFCSKRCCRVGSKGVNSGSWKGDLLNKSCLNCKKIFRSTAKTFCSLKCAHDFNRRVRLPAKVGSRYVPTDSKNSITVYMPQHPRAHNRRVKEHILVAERALGSFLPEPACVHHWNSNRQDNRPENLLICENQSYHMLIEVRAKRLRDTGNLNLRRCSRCRRIKELSQFHRKITNWDGH